MTDALPTTRPGGLSFEERMPPAQIFFSLTGRISRRVFWLWGVGTMVAVSVAASLLLGIAGVGDEQIAMIVNALMFWPGLAISVKRWHDRDKSGWWVLINLVPFIGWLWALIENGFLRGTAGPNRYGADPLAQRELIA